MPLMVPNFGKARVLVIGDIMLDRYWLGATSRISPEAPVPIVKIGSTENKLGGAANVAHNLAALGCDVSLCGIIGNDEAGKSIESALEQLKITNYLHINNFNPTITKLRVISQHQQLIRLDFEEKLHNLESNFLVDMVKECIAKMDAVILSDYAKGTVKDAQDFIALCNKHQVPVLVDPKGSDFSRYQNVSVITPNLSELEAVTGKCETLDEVFTRAKTLTSRLRAEALLVTLSERGMALIRPKAPPLHIPAHAKDVFDVTGAGDTVIATLAACLAAKADLSLAVKLSNLAAGLVVGKLGTATVSREELIDAATEEQAAHHGGVTTHAKLKNLVDSARKKGEKIVFTNGCFDILHAGHVRYLQQAAELGERLIVAVNSDDSVKKLKGDERPINNLKSRMEVLASLRCVDWVVDFNDETPATLIKELMPDLLVKGGDYKREEIVGFDTVTGNGGDVVVIPFVDGFSTTSVIEKARKS